VNVTVLHALEAIYRRFIVLPAAQGRSRVGVACGHPPPSRERRLVDIVITEKA